MSKDKPLEPRRSRKEIGHTQVQAAQLLGVSLRTWENWEGGISLMPPPMLLLYRHLAGVERIPYRGGGAGMKFYRNRFRCGRCGTFYTWHCSKLAAEQDADRQVYETHSPDTCKDMEWTTEVHDITPTRAGIFQALEGFASHHDKG